MLEIKIEFQKKTETGWEKIWSLPESATWESDIEVHMAKALLNAPRLRGGEWRFVMNRFAQMLLMGQIAVNKFGNYRYPHIVNIVTEIVD
jgi:hypothetical protein